MSSFKPTLAVAADLSKIRYPVFASPKLDGIRCSIVDGRALTRTLKPVPNRHINKALSKLEFTGFDGELIFGTPTSESVYRDTNSVVMRHGGTPEVSYYVFDLHNSVGGFSDRVEVLRERVRQLSAADVQIRVLEQVEVTAAEQLLEYEERCLIAGFEGLILRSFTSPYKYGRSTVNEGYMLKVKRFTDGEAVVIGIEEEMYNGNEAEINELGRIKRSTAVGGLVGKGTLGALVVRELGTGVEFKIGTGFDAAERQLLWAAPPIGKIVTFKHFECGRFSAPRHPVFKGFRATIDL